MKRHVLGLDINDEYVAAVVVRQSGQDKLVEACGFERYHDRDELYATLPQLLQQVGWKESLCTCGVSLTGISLRNLTIPFTEKRKISQILPLELEDQLLGPAGDQLVEYIITGGGDTESQLLVTALKKSRMQQHLELLKGSGLKPDVLTSSTVALVEQLQRTERSSDGFLLVDAGLHTVTIAIVIHDQIHFLRRVAYPDKVFTAHPFMLEAEGPVIADNEVASECITALCNDIKICLGFYQLDSGIESVPEKIILSGCMAQVASFREKIAAEFKHEVVVANLLEQQAVTLEKSVGDEWDHGVFDHALALALQGLRRKFTFNFCKDEFAPKKSLLATRTQQVGATLLLLVVLIGSLAYLGNDNRVLQNRYDELETKMKAVFKETFPEITRVDGNTVLAEMQVSLRDVQAPATSTPIFSGSKRVLNILADISGRIPVSIKIHVARLVIDKESVVVKGTTDTFNNVNLIQGVLRKSPEFIDVDIVSAAADKDSGMIRFELKMKTAGAKR